MTDAYKYSLHTYSETDMTCYDSSMSYDLIHADRSDFVYV